MFNIGVTQQDSSVGVHDDDDDAHSAGQQQQQQHESTVEDANIGNVAAAVNQIEKKSNAEDTAVDKGDN